MAQEINNVTLTGASGTVGSAILKALLEANKFNITVLVRSDKTSFPASVQAKVVDFESLPSLTQALQGQDAVIDATPVITSDTSIRLVTAAAASGVRRFILSEFSVGPENHKVRHLPVFQGKNEVFGHVQKLAADNQITYTSVSNGGFLDWILRTGFLHIDFAKKRVELLNDGKAVMPFTTLETVGRATVNTLLHLEETRNRNCYIYSAYKSQKQVVELAMEALGVDGWNVTQVDMDRVLKEALAELEAGRANFKVVADIIRYSISRSDLVGPWAEDDNELLGVETMTDEEVKDLIKEIASKEIASE